MLLELQLELEEIFLMEETFVYQGATYRVRRGSYDYPSKVPFLLRWIPRLFSFFQADEPDTPFALLDSMVDGSWKPVPKSRQMPLVVHLLSEEAELEDDVSEDTEG